MVGFDGDEEPLRREGGKLRGAKLQRSQFAALMRKNAKFKLRGPGLVCSILEVVLPCVFFALMCLPRGLIDPQEYNPTLYPEESLGSFEWGRKQPIGYVMRFSPDDASAKAIGNDALKRLFCGNDYRKGPSESSFEGIPNSLLQDLTSALGSGDASSGSVEPLLTNPPSQYSIPLLIANIGKMSEDQRTAAQTFIANYDNLCSNESEAQWSSIEDTFLSFSPSEDDALSLASENGGETLAVVALQGAGSADPSITVRINGTNIGDIIDDRFVFKYEAVSPPTGWANYYNFVNVQNAASQAVIGEQYRQNNNNDAIFRAETYMKQSPWVSYEVNLASAVAAQFAAIVVTLGFSTTSVLVLKGVVQEKELRLREGMRMKGMTDSMFWLSWFVTHWATLAVVSVLVALIGIYPFPNTAFTCNLVFFLLWTVMLVVFNYFLSTFFDRSRLATILGNFVYTLSIAPGIALSSIYPEGVTGFIWVALAPASALYAWTQAISELELGQRGLTWSTIDANVLSQGNFTAESILLIVVLDIFIYLALALYLDNALPSKLGTRKHPLFFLLPSYWRPLKFQPGRKSNAIQDSQSPDEASKQKATVESLPESEENNAAIQIRDLRKTFGDVNAVDGLNVSFVSGSISALLGHNGAGKTTTLKMLVGEAEPTSGDAIIDGKSIRTNMQGIREELGICPQFNVLWPDLTVREHLQLYASFAGVPARDTSRQEIDRRIEEVGLVEKADSLSKSLSGGQKRKLGVAMAFIGSPRVVMLDEPTSGMDPYSRRFTWEVIRRQRQGTAILLTTHFLDEADLLCDRIAIMSAGRIAAAGTNVFLKGQYGGNFHLTIDKAGEKTPSGPIADLVHGHVEEATVVDDVGAELSMSLPSENAKDFPELINALEDNAREVGVASYGISCTTLEEVFLTIAERAHKAEKESSDGSSEQKATGKASKLGGRGKKKKRKSESLPEQPRVNNNEPVGDDAENTASKGMTRDKPYLTGTRLLNRQLWSLLLKRVLIAKRDYMTLVFQLLIPSLFVILALALSKASPADDNTYGSKELTRSLINGMRPARGGGRSNGFLEGYPSEMLPIESGTDELAGCSCFCPSEDQEGSSEFDRACSTDVSSFQCAETERGNLVREQCVATFSNTLDAFLLSRQEELTTCENEENGVCDSFFINSYPEQSQLQSGGDMIFNHTVMPNPSSLYSLPVGLHSLNAALFKSVTGNDNGNLRVVNNPLPKQPSEIATEDDDSDVGGIKLFVSILVALGSAVLSSGYVVFLAWERSSNAKHLQVVSGVNKLVFWLSNLLVDLTTYLVPWVVFVILFAAFSPDSYDSPEALGAIAVLFLCFGWAGITLTYSLHFFFKSEMNALVGLISATGFIGFGTLLAGVILESIKNDVDGVEPVYNALKYVFRILPHYCLSKGLYDVATNSERSDSLTFNANTGTFETQETKYFFAWDVIGAHIFFLILMGAVFMCLTLVIEYLESRVSPDRFQSPRDADSSGQDADVLREKERIEKANMDEIEDAAALRGIKKAYTGGKVAVRSLSVGVAEGQCFGLLGINGAGKTTTFKILTREIQPTAGDGFVKGRVEASNSSRRKMLSVTKQANEARQVMGYCPQFDGIHGNLTARELLRLYARLRGAPSSEIPDIVKSLLGKMQLTRYADRLSGTYSGGNKRKLGVAIALVGEPPVVLLDEPTTGMDPEARRFTWKCISQSMPGRATILTSHSMDECEALCHKVGIMVGGRFRCLGSVQHIKSKYGRGYYASFRVPVGQTSTLREWMEGISSEHGFESAEVVEAHGSQCTYHVVCDGKGLARLFEEVEDVRRGNRELQLLDYTIAQTTLEQVFVQFASQQEEEAAIDLGDNRREVGSRRRGN